MIYGILASNSVHLSEISHSLKETITLKKTIERISRNLHDFEDSQTVMDNSLSMLKQHGKEEYFKLKKQQFNLEDFCVMFQSLFFMHLVTQ